MLRSFDSQCICVEVCEVYACTFRNATRLRPGSMHVRFSRPIPSSLWLFHGFPWNVAIARIIEEMKSLQPSRGSAAIVLVSAIEFEYHVEIVLANDSRVNEKHSHVDELWIILENNSVCTLT